MFNLSLLDALAILYILYSLASARNKSLGESLHGLITIVLIICLLMGLRLAREIRGFLSWLGELMQMIPGLGSKLLIILIAWYLMHLVRKRLAFWIEKSIPEKHHKSLTLVTQPVKAALLILLFIWIFEGWFEPTHSNTPQIVKAVRYGDRILSHQPRSNQQQSFRPYR